MTHQTIDADAILNRARPVIHDQALEGQPYGHIVTAPSCPRAPVANTLRDLRAGAAVAIREGGPVILDGQMSTKCDPTFVAGVAVVLP